MPGITAATAAGAQIGASLTQRGIARSVAFVTPRIGDEETGSDWAAAALAADTAAIAGKTALAATPWEGVFVYGSQDPRCRLLTDLGFSLPADLDKVTKSAWGGDLSDESVDLLDVDAVVWLVEGNGRKDIEANKAYTCPWCHRELPRGLGHVVVVPYGAADLRRHWHHGCWQKRVRVG